jgi:hypothetical protein
MKVLGIILIVVISLLIFEDISKQQAFAKTTLEKSIDISLKLAVPEGLTFSPDGLKMYIPDNTGDLIEEYTLSAILLTETETQF